MYGGGVMNIFRNGGKVYTFADIERLEQQLAKANERIKQLESELVSRHNHIQELRQEAGEYAVLIAKANERVKELEQSKHKESLETISDYILEFMQSQNIENFSTNRLSTNEGRQIESTVRYVDGETPADLLTKANERIAELKDALLEQYNYGTLELRDIERLMPELRKEQE